MAISLGVDGYCQASDVISYLQVTISTTTDPSTAETEDFIKNRATEINGTLAAIGYDTPIASTYTEASKILKQINIHGASIDVLEAKTRAAGSREVSGRVQNLQGVYSDELDRLAKRRLSLIDAPVGGGTLQEADAALPKGEYNLDSNDEELDPLIERDTEF